MPTLKQIEIFVRIAETGNMNDAALALGLTQPALSQQLRTLEARLGITLFERVPKGMQLTPHGRELLSNARSVISSARELSDAANHLASRPAGSIRFGVTPTLGPYIMPRVIKELHLRYPDLRLLIREGLPASQQRQLAEGELDMLLAPLPIAGKGLHVEPLFRERLRIVAPPDDPLLERETLSRSDFAGRTFLSLDHRHPYHQQLAEISDGLGASVLSDYEGTSLDALQQMVGSGVGLAVLPELYIRSGAGGLDVVRIAEPDGWSAHRSIAASWRSSAAYAQTFEEIARLVAQEGRGVGSEPEEQS